MKVSVGLLQKQLSMNSVAKLWHGSTMSAAPAVHVVAWIRDARDVVAWIRDAGDVVAWIRDAGDPQRERSGIRS